MVPKLIDSGSQNLKRERLSGMEYKSITMCVCDMAHRLRDPGNLPCPCSPEKLGDMATLAAAACCTDWATAGRRQSLRGPRLAAACKGGAREGGAHPRRAGRWRTWRSRRCACSSGGARACRPVAAQAAPTRQRRPPPLPEAPERAQAQLGDPRRPRVPAVHGLSHFPALADAPRRCHTGLYPS